MGAPALTAALKLLSPTHGSVPDGRGRQTALAWLVFLPLAWLLGRELGYGLVGAYAGGTVYVALLAGGLLWRFASGQWRAVRI